MTDTGVERIPVHGAEEALSVVPSLLGFTPAAGSIVTLLLDDTGAVQCVARIDTLASAETDTPDPVGIAHHLVSVASRIDTAATLVFGYDHPETPGQTSAPITVLAETFHRAGIVVLDTAQQCGTQWRAGAGEDWQPLTSRVSVAQAMLVGKAPIPLPSRDAVVALLGPTPDARTATVANARERVAGWEWWEQVASLAAALESPQSASAETLAAAAAAFSGPLSRRDAILACLIPGLVPEELLPPEEVAVCRKYLGASWLPGRPSRADAVRVAQTAAVTPEPDCLGLLIAAGCVASAAGDGVLASSAWERARTIEPDHALARLLLHLLGMGINPTELNARS